MFTSVAIRFRLEGVNISSDGNTMLFLNAWGFTHTPYQERLVFIPSAPRYVIWF